VPQPHVHEEPVGPTQRELLLLGHPAARKVSGWPKRCKLAHALLWEYSYKGLELAQLLGQLGVFLTPGERGQTPCWNAK
jgi:hypothetical protein